jgi:hypothetical protein
MEIDQQLKDLAKNKLNDAKEQLKLIPNGSIKSYLESTLNSVENGKSINVNSFLNTINNLTKKDANSN